MQNLFQNTENKRSKIIYGLFLLLNDVIALTFSCFISYYLRFFTRIFKTVEFTYKINSTYIYFSIYFILIAISALLIFRLYNIQRNYSKPGLRKTMSRLNIDQRLIPRTGIYHAPVLLCLSSLTVP